MPDKETVRIEIDFYYVEGEDLVKQTKEAISDNLGEFLEYCERLIDIGDARMEVIGGSLQLADFDFSPETLDGSMSFSFDSYFYAGCKDMNSYDDHDSERMFEFNVDLENQKIVFEEFELPPPWQPDLAMEYY